MNGPCVKGIFVKGESGATQQPDPCRLARQVKPFAG
jgi:hypothetical protein